MYYIIISTLNIRGVMELISNPSSINQSMLSCWADSISMSLTRLYYTIISYVNPHTMVMYI